VDPVAWSGKRGWDVILFRSGTSRSGARIAYQREPPRTMSAPHDHSSDDETAAAATRDIADVAAVEVITTTAVHLMSAAAVKVGLADDPDAQIDLDEARKLINSLAGLVTAAAPEISDMHARSLRDGLRSLQLAFREASPFPDPIGQGPGEKWTGPVT
jgi:hypothetical protein